MSSIDRERYARIYGPTAGDRVRLADTDLWIEVESDATSYGDEALIGLGKTIRDGALASSGLPGDSELDVVITNAVVMDPMTGISKTNIGIKDGQIVSVGRAGNRDVVDDVDVLIGTTTTVIPAEGLIATAGGVDSHVHLISPGLVPVALAAGMTTLVGMGSGPTWDVGVNPAWVLRRMEEAFADHPVNVVYLARGSSSRPEPLERVLLAGAGGLKVHEDTGGGPAVLDAALRVAEAQDVAVAVHFDGLGETGDLSDFLRAIDGRTVHAYHVEGAGGGPPDLLEVVQEPNVLPSSTTPTIPYGVNALAEHADMIATSHLLHADLEGDAKAAAIRLRGGTMAAEEHLHDLGAISITNSDAMGMGRVGETIRRTWQMAHRMKGLLGPASDGPDNDRVLRYLAKYTINPAIAHGLGARVGSLEAGKLADVVLWRPGWFGVKPEFIVKSGFIAWAAIGEGNASVERAEPVLLRPMFGAHGRAAASLGVTFACRAAVEAGAGASSPRPWEAVRGTRGVRKEDMVRNAARPAVAVDPGRLTVRVDGEEIRSEPAGTVALNRLYVLS